MNWQIAGVVISMSVSGLSFLGFLGIWFTWKGEVTATINQFKQAIQDLRTAIDKLKERDDLYVKKYDYEVQVVKRDRELENIWKAVNEQRKEIAECQKAHR